MLKKFKKRAAKLFVSLLLFLPLLNDASAASDNLSYDVLSQQFIQAPADFREFPAVSYSRRQEAR